MAAGGVIILSNYISSPSQVSPLSIVDCRQGRVDRWQGGLVNIGGSLEGPEGTGLGKQGIAKVIEIGETRRRYRRCDHPGGNIKLRHPILPEQLPQHFRGDSPDANGSSRFHHGKLHRVQGNGLPRGFIEQGNRLP